ncbi:MAG: bifunctional pyr operon transcriptional regulator/uracil phosphoribosyltransferase PyrR [Terriglobia bacterium]
MGFHERSVIMDGDGVNRTLTRMAHEIVEANKGAGELVFVGIRSRGVYLAERLRNKVKEIEGSERPLGTLDVSFYRDDIGTLPRPQVETTDIPFDIESKAIVLVDDVLYTGRTIRAAMDALMDFGRPASIQLAVMVDRGHRELPIRADFVGKNIPTAAAELVRVSLTEEDKTDAVMLGELVE